MSDSPESIDRLAKVLDEAMGSIEGHGLWFAMDEPQRDRWRAAVRAFLAELRKTGSIVRAEREACAKLADARAAHWEAQTPTINHDGKPELGPSLHAFEDHAIAAAIRNRV